MATVTDLPFHLSRFGLLGTFTGVESDIPNWRVVSLESVSTEVIIRGFVAQVSAKLVYSNITGGPLQVKAVFPVEEGAAVYYCEARLDGRTIVTHCMEKQKAEKVYQEAVSAGKTAVMASEHDESSDILKLNLGNLPPESKAELTLRLVMELKVETDGAISFVLPTVLNPRYCPADHPHRQAHNYMRGWGYTTERVVHVPQPYSIDVKARVIGSHQIARVLSHTDSLTVTLTEDALSAQVSQDGGFRCDHDWSMLVYYSNAYQPHLLRETGDRADTGLMKDDLLMLNLFPEVPGNTFSCRNEIIFVIDRSGSMQGEKIQSAKATLLLFLKSLPAGCLFNVVSFGSTFSLLFPEGSQKYTEKTLNIASDLQANMYADMGGTEIYQPLHNIYSKPPTPGYSRQILLITDGEVWNVDQVLQLVARHAHETRVFSVGVGHGASTALVRGAARAGRGRSEMVVQQSLLQQKVMGLVSSMVQENVQNVTVSCEVEPATRVTLVPKVPPVIFGGQHLILYARVPPTTEVKSITVRGQLGTEPIVNRLEGRHFTVVHDEAKSLHRLAARAQIQQWQLDEEEDVAEDMVALSVASGVVSRRTALVGVDQESGNPIPEFQSLGIHHSQEHMQLQQHSLFGLSMPPSSLNGPQGTTKNHFVPLRRKKCRAEHQSLTPLLSMCCAQSSMPLSYRCMSSSDSAATIPAFGFGGTAPSSDSAVPAQSFSFGGTAPSSNTNTPTFDATLFGGLDVISDDLQHNSGKMRRTMMRNAQRCRVTAEQKRERQNMGPDAQPVAGLMEVVQLQQFDGSWKLKDAAQLTGVPLDILSANNPAKQQSEASWGTALVLVVLERKFADQRDQWVLLAMKAQMFLSQCGEQQEELLAKARLILDSK